MSPTCSSANPHPGTFSLSLTLTFTQLRTNTAEIFPSHIKEDLLARKLDRKGRERKNGQRYSISVREKEREMERKKGTGRERN